MSYATQCTHEPPGASGSSTIKAKLFVSDGAPSQFNSGDASSRSHECLAGMGWLFRKLGLLNVNRATVYSLRNLRYPQVLLANRSKTRILHIASGMTPTQVGACQPRRERLRWLAQGSQL